ncbi:hypothetical protein [Desulfoplanes sp.]
MIYVVTQCTDCPFHQVHDGKRSCKVASVVHQEIPADEKKRPEWCPLRKEQMIVRDKNL